MNEQRIGSQKATSTNKQRGMEMILFLVASVIGIYGLGQGLQGLFEPGQGINFIWLAVTGVAMFVLFAQMGRVHDTWPKRKARQQELAGHTEAAQEPQELSETHSDKY
jgi:hypothetical protein